MSVLTAYATLTGTNREQLAFRLYWIAREYARSTVTKPGRPARLDVRSDEARSMAGALDDAIRILVDQDPVLSRPALAEAVRRAENRWEKVRADLRRSGTTWADLRPYPANRQAEPPGEREAEPVRRLTLVHDSRTVEASRYAETHLTPAAETGAGGRRTAGPRLSDNRIAEKATVRYRHRELSRQR